MRADQRYRVGPNYLQLPVNSAKNANVATNQRGGQMSYGTDLAPGQNPRVNYEPSITGGVQEAPKQAPSAVGPELEGRLTRERIERTNDHLQAGQRFQLMEQWEKEELVKNFVANISR